MTHSIKKNTEKNTKDLNKNVDSNKLVKKGANEPDEAKENLDIPGARAARPLTNDRHQGDKMKQDKSPKKEPIENIVLDTEYVKKKK
ncbi:hypothetical protein CJ739_3481 [Mariniflexile rhizosphaerae]|uniref:hypothetical protein n=1 Tax=unclassified Mariniflexile TaxID=2643887 RepID=UPI000CBDCCFE|nr:hypothetical protein [Mariniflexile sp. TRM1-10]AXP82543.1 hypothetical protein CJ739_3481 [Mariniflexile sp. TRM1-10]PLB19546.1 MAG: hypothetical protein TRG1_1595 [Flavobacteriaceae bacterium FS1-H7996/R]